MPRTLTTWELREGVVRAVGNVLAAEYGGARQIEGDYASELDFEAAASEQLEQAVVAYAAALDGRSPVGS
jgi:hypothetical protein